jgi:hypothetical protein
MIGAWIPADIICIDLDRHAGKVNGVLRMNEIKKEYGINYSLNDTFTVTTGGNGIHLFYITDKTFTQNTKTESIDLKTNKGYIIAAGSPGYKIFSENEPIHLPLELDMWLDNCEYNKKEKPVKSNIIDNDTIKVF